MINIEVLYQEKDLSYIALNKPAGLSCHKTSNPDELDLCTWAETKYQKKFSPVHRLDKETSGVIILSSEKETTSKLQRAMELGKKKYEAILRGQVDQDVFWDNPITNKAEGRKSPLGKTKERVQAQTKVKVLAKNKFVSLVECEILTGRQHQIRKHAKINGHEVLNDKRYGDPKYIKLISLKYSELSMCLHAKSIEIELAGVEISFSTPRPKAWEKVINEKDS